MPIISDFVRHMYFFIFSLILLAIDTYLLFTIRKNRKDIKEFRDTYRSILGLWAQWDDANEKLGNDNAKKTELIKKLRSEIRKLKR